MRGQITVRLPRDLARALARRARERGVPKSQMVREAILGYLSASPEKATPVDTWQRIAPFIGSLELDTCAAERDALAKQIRDHNWRE